jgi:hypothetical protein
MISFRVCFTHSGDQEGIFEHLTFGVSRQKQKRTAANGWMNGWMNGTETWHAFE